MKQLICRLLPQTLVGQIMGVVVIAFILIIATGSAFERVTRSEYFAVADMDQIKGQAETVAKLMRSASLEEREKILAVSAYAGMNFKVLGNDELLKLPDFPSWRTTLNRLFQTVFPFPKAHSDGKELLMNGKPVFAYPLDRQNTLVYLDIPDTILTLQVLNPASYYFIGLASLLGLIALFAIKAVTRPLKAISDAVEHSGNNISSEQLFAERGSIEIVGLARGLNKMRARIRLMLENRSRMLRSVSHDLRTPLTRMRLRTERMDPSTFRTSMLNDIGHIEELVTETLEYLRYDVATEEFQRADIASILQSVCAEFQDVGFSVSYEGADRLVALCKPSALARAITNLCDNSVKFAGNVTVGLSTTSLGVRISVRDDGPGIPKIAYERVIEPFYKLDASRSAAGKHGFGLGLSIVADIVQSHEGILSFESNSPSGLSVLLDIPGTFANA